MITFFFSLQNSYAQNRNKRWYFGNLAGINFTNNPPNSTTGNSNMSQGEGCATMCNSNGQLLFYTDGMTVWKSNYQPMLNGNGLKGNASTSQSSIIIPKPGNNDIYYIFTIPAGGVPDSLRYSIVDMTLNGGFGDVTEKNIALFGYVSEKITGTIHGNGIDYWVVVKELMSNVFLSYKITSEGISSTPVISHAGIITSSIFDDGYARISRDGSKLAVAFSNDYTTQIFDFDKFTGEISNALTLPPAGYQAYGVEFSPDNSKLYITDFDTSSTSGRIYTLRQFNLLAGSTVAIQNSGIEILSRLTGQLPNPLGWAGALMVGPDDKIYISRMQCNFVSVIQQPNLSGMACNFVEQGIMLTNGTTCRWGLPNNLYYPNLAVVPATLSSFIVSCKKKTELEWKTELELDTKMFSIEGSDNAVSWTRISSVHAKGDYSHYQFTDPQSSYTLYRLCFTDINGRNTYSEVVTSKCEKKFKVNVYPQPANTKLNVMINSLSNENATILIIDLNGKVVFSENTSFVKGINNILLNLRGIVSGEYFIQLCSKAGSFLQHITVIK